MLDKKIDDRMTSELAYLSKLPEDEFGMEYARRLSLLNLSDEQISNLYNHEKKILGLKQDNDRGGIWGSRIFITKNSSSKGLPKIEELTLSELLLLTDDANSALVRDHEWLPDEAMESVFIAACEGPSEGRYAKEYNKRTAEMSWSKAQNCAYVRNECLLIERIKWRWHNEQAWTKETVGEVMKRYQR